MSFPSLTRTQLKEQTPKFEPSDEAKRRVSSLLNKSQSLPQILAGITDPVMREEAIHIAAAEERKAMSENIAHILVKVDKDDQKTDFAIEQNLEILNQVKQTNGTVKEAQIEIQLIKDRHEREDRKAEIEAAVNEKLRLEHKAEADARDKRLQKAENFGRWFWSAFGTFILAALYFIAISVIHELKGEHGSNTQSTEITEKTSVTKP